MLTAFAIMLGSLTIITSRFGMNLPLPVLRGGNAARCWWTGDRLALTAAAPGFRRKAWG